jgi:hypothetical protein
MTSTLNPDDGLPPKPLKNDSAGIILRLGNGWDEASLKEFAEMLAGICKDFNDAKLPVTMELVKVTPPPLIILPPKAGDLVVVDAQGRLQLRPDLKLAKPAEPEPPAAPPIDKDLGDLL